MSVPTASILICLLLLFFAIAAAVLQRAARSRALDAAEELRVAHEQKIRETTRQMSESGALTAQDIQKAGAQPTHVEPGDQSYEAQFASLSDTVEPALTETEWTSQDLDMVHALSVDETRY